MIVMIVICPLRTSLTGNHFLDRDWFKKLFFTYSLANVIGQFVIGQFVIGQFVIGLYVICRLGGPYSEKL